MPMRIIFGTHGLTNAATVVPSVETELKNAVASVTLQTDALRIDFTAVLGDLKAATSIHWPVTIPMGGSTSPVLNNHSHPVGTPVPYHSSI